MSTDIFSRLDHWLPPHRAQWLTICYVIVIYATLPVMRPVLNFLKGTLGDAFSPAVYVLLFFIALGVIALFLRQGKGWGSFVVLFGILGVTAFILPTVKYPEERVHFVEYAVLGIMLYFALRGIIGGRSVLICIPVIVFLVGLVDELIQGVLPNRVYQCTDILLNFCGGVLGELILVVFNPHLIKERESVSNI